MPALHGGDDVLRIGAPDEGCGSLVVLRDEIVDHGLQGDHGVEDAALQLSAARLSASVMTALRRASPVRGGWVRLDRFPLSISGASAVCRWVPFSGWHAGRA